jgi:hypothetical protein
MKVLYSRYTIWASDGMWHWYQMIVQTVLYSRHTIWMADGMWHWYKMIVQTVLYSRHTIWTADGMWHWYQIIVQKDTIQLVSIGLYDRIIQSAHHMDCRWHVALV